MERIPTGIAGLDALIGGFVAGKTVLLVGEAGSGKTVFGLQFAVTSAGAGRNTVYLTTEECVGDLIAQCSSFCPDVAGLVQEGKLCFVDLSSRRRAEIEAVVEIGLAPSKFDPGQILSAISSGTRVVVLDQLGCLLNGISLWEFRERFDLLVHSLGRAGLTALVVLDGATSGEFREIALFSACGAIRLAKRDDPFTGKRQRVMDIIKVRATRIPVQLLMYEIGADGITLTGGI